MMASLSEILTPPCAMISRIDRRRCWFTPMRPVTPFMTIPTDRTVRELNAPPIRFPHRLKPVPPLADKFFPVTCQNVVAQALACEISTVMFRYSSSEASLRQATPEPQRLLEATSHPAPAANARHPPPGRNNKSCAAASVPHSSVDEKLPAECIPPARYSK